MFELDLENQTLDGRYQIIRRFPPGSFSEIFEATDLHERKCVIIKALNPNLKGPPDPELKKKLLDNFQQEAELLAKLEHPNIVKMMGQGSGADRSGRSFDYLVLENLVGGDLNKKYRRQPFTLSETLHYFQQVCEGLSAAHLSGIIHRDIKPDNLMFSADRRQIKIIDFGVAKKLSGDRNREVTRVGTDLYSPPEHNPLSHGIQEPLTPAADVYSLAKTIYAAMSGKPPSEFRHRPITYLPSPLNTMPWAEHLLRILQRATEERVGDRYVKVTDFWQDFLTLANYHPQKITVDRKVKPPVQSHDKPPFSARHDNSPVRITTPVQATSNSTRKKDRIVVDLSENLLSVPLQIAPAPAPLAVPEQTWRASLPEERTIVKIAGSLVMLCLFAVVIIVAQSLLVRYLPVEAASLITIILSVLVVLIGFLSWQEYRQKHEVPKWGDLPLNTFEFEVAKVNAMGQITSRRKGTNKIFIEELEEDHQLEMVLIPAGSFLMGSPTQEKERMENEGPQHQVTLPSFFLSRFAITQVQWQIVAQWPKIKWELNPQPSPFTGDELPIVNISYYEAIEFCNRLSQVSGRNYRLPSESEWEYACRAGSMTPFHFGENITAEVVSYDGQFPYDKGAVEITEEQPSTVGKTGIVNAFGLSDMHGNVWEWCKDAWHDDYHGAPDNGAAWKSPFKSALRVIRGGSWFNPATLCRSAYRFGVPASQASEDRGFRIAMTSANLK